MAVLPSFAIPIAEIASLDWTNEPIAASLPSISGRAPGGRQADGQVGRVHGVSGLFMMNGSLNLD
jgi:hypothetical protein